MLKNSIVWFRQDLRVHDNTALFEAVTTSESILPIFILDKNIIGSFGGLNDKKFGFIREALDNLNNQVKNKGGKGLVVYHDYPEKLLPEISKKYNIEKVYVNRVYDNYGKNRDKIVSEKLHDLGVEFEDFGDYLLAEPEDIKTMKVFSPYYNRWKKAELNTQILDIDAIHQLDIDYHGRASDYIDQEKHPYFTIDFGKKRLENHISQNYDDVKNMLDKDSTSRLSVYIRFGIFSIREVYHKALGVNEPYIRELAWRDFWNHIFQNFSYTVDTEFLEKRRGIEWSDDKELFQKWCDGETGYPVVDAAMKQLNKTNWMHGRARMIVSSFLTKDLHIDWRLGEKYFREKLLDYDQAVNIGNWQWGASVGADPKPLRIFNPILQSQKFDPQASYIKKYLPDLDNIEAQILHDPLKNNIPGYIEPVVDHVVEQRKARELYKKSSV